MYKKYSWPNVETPLDPFSSAFRCLSDPDYFCSRVLPNSIHLRPSSQSSLCVKWQLSCLNKKQCQKAKQGTKGWEKKEREGEKDVKKRPPRLMGQKIGPRRYCPEKFPLNQIITTAGARSRLDPSVHLSFAAVAIPRLSSSLSSSSSSSSCVFNVGGEFKYIC